MTSRFSAVTHTNVEYVKNVVLQNCNCIFSTLEGAIGPKNMKGLCHIAKCTTGDYSLFSSISRERCRQYHCNRFEKPKHDTNFEKNSPCHLLQNVYKILVWVNQICLLKKKDPLLNDTEVRLLLPCCRNHFLLWLTAPLVAEMTQPMWFRKTFCVFYLAKSSS